MALGRKTGGRIAGTPNKVPAAVKERIAELLEAYSLEQMIADLNEITAKDRLWVLHGMAEFVAPKLQRSEVAQTNDGQLIIKVVRTHGSNGRAENPALESGGGTSGGEAV